MDKDPPNPASRSRKPKTTRKTKPIPSREDEKRAYLGHFYSQMMFGGCSIQEIEEEQVKASARFDKWKPEKAEEISRPSENLGPADPTTVSLISKPEPEPEPSVTELSTSEKPRPSVSSTSEPTQPVPVSEVSKPELEANVAEVSLSANFRPLKKAKPSGDSTAPPKNSKPADLTTVSLEEKPVQISAEVSPPEASRLSEEARSSPTGPPKPTQPVTVPEVPKPADLTTVPLESKPEPIVAEDSPSEDSRPSATPEPTQPVPVSKAPKPADPTTVPIESKPNVAKVSLPENPRPLEDSGPSEDSTTPIAPPKGSKPADLTTVTLDSKPEPVMTKVAPPANPSPPEKARPVTRQRFPSSSESEDDSESDSGRKKPPNYSLIFKAAKENEYWNSSWTTSEDRATGSSSTVTKTTLPASENPRPPIETPRPPVNEARSQMEIPRPPMGNPRPPMEIPRPPMENHMPLPVTFLERLPAATETRPTNLTMQEEILELTEEELEIYTKTLQNLSATHNISISSTPEDPSFRDQFEIVRNFTPEQSIRFQAILAARGDREPSEDPQTNESPFVTSVTGHYGLYQVQDRGWSQWMAVAWYPTKIEKVLVTEDSKIIGSTKPAYPTVILGDVLVVKEVRDGVALRFQILKRVWKTEQAAVLNNDRYVVKGYGRAVGFKTASNNMLYLRKAYFYEPIKCSVWSPDAVTIWDVEIEERRSDSWANIWQAFYQKFKTLSPESTDYFAVLGSSLYTALQYGKFDETRYMATQFRAAPNDLIDFNPMLGNTRNQFWTPGVHVSVDNRWLLEIVRYTFFKDQRSHLVTAKLLRGDGELMALFKGPEWPIRQIGAHVDRPMLEAGFLEKLDEKSNGRRIISAIFGPLVKWAESEGPQEPLEYPRPLMQAIREGVEPNEKLMEHLENNWDTVQLQYMRRLLDHAPITVGKFSILSGKSSTVIMAAQKLAQRDSTSLNLIVVPDAKRAEMMDVRIRELSNLGLMSNEVKIRRLGAFDLDPPQVLILDLKEFWRNFKLFKIVASIQFDDMHEIPQMELIHIATVFPDAVYGLMGDPHAARFEFKPFYKWQNALVGGELVRKAQNYYPVVESRELYNVPVDVVNILAKLYNKVDGIWMDSEVKLEEYPVGIWTAQSQRSMLDILRTLLQKATVPAEEVGVLCANSKQVTEAQKHNFLDHGILLGLAEDFVGVQKKVVIVLVDTSMAVTEHQVSFLMTRATERIHLVKLEWRRDEEEWKKLWRMIEGERQKITLQS